MSDIENAKPAILLPPLSFLGDAPFITLSSGVLEKKVLLSYPISLYTRENGKINWLGFLYAFLFTGKEGERVASIAYPLCFDESYKQEIFERLLKEVEELASAFKASRIEYEGYQHVTGELFKPCSTIVFGNTPNADFLDFVKTKEFIQTRITSCYEIEWSSTREGNVHVYTAPDFHHRRRHYLELCSVSDSFYQEFDVESVLSLPPDTTERFLKEEWVVFTQSERERGCLRWFPQSLFDHTRRREAKIARLLFDKCTPEFVCDSVVETMNRIASAGMNLIQIGDVPEGSTESCLESLGGSKVCEIVYMAK